MIRSIYRAPDGRYHVDLPPAEFPAALQDANGLLWVDFVGEPPEVCEPILRQTFGFHPLAVDDALRETHMPKIDDWEQYLYLVLPAVVFDRHDGVYVDTLELDVFLGPNYVVTHHDQPITAVDRVWMTCQRDERTLKKDADHLLYRLVDELATSYMPVVDELDEAIDRIEDQIFDKPTPAMLEEIFALKRAVVQLRRILSPQREVLNRLARDDYAVVDAEDRVYFRDVYDHLVRLYDINEGLRDLVSGTLDTYLSVVNNRLNDVMKTLTIITTLFMPISFLSGFFGMNFFQPVASLDVWTGLPAFVLTLAIMIALPAGMALWLRRRGWM